MPQSGTVCWIGIRPERRGRVEEVEQISVSFESGIEGDHYAGKPGAARQVTLIQKEHIDTVSSIVGTRVEPELLRRNIVVKGLNLLALKDQKFSIGTVILKTTGNCHPCSRMETNLGPGGYNAMRGHGGITATVVQGGVISVGDSVGLIKSGSDQG